MYADTELIREMPKLRKFATRLVGNAADAEDLVQMTALRALEKKEMFEDGTNLFSWTSRIMFNIFVTDYRRKKKFETQYDPQSHLESLSMDAPQEMETDIARLHDAMLRLSPSHREILVMVCVRNMQYHEVSELLGIPVGTVRSRLSRARESLLRLFRPANCNGAIFNDGHRREMPLAV